VWCVHDGVFCQQDDTGVYSLGSIYSYSVVSADGMLECERERGKRGEEETNILLEDSLLLYYDVGSQCDPLELLPTLFTILICTDIATPQITSIDEYSIRCYQAQVSVPYGFCAGMFAVYVVY
jgi:hypothetical protein